MDITQPTYRKAIVTLNNHRERVNNILYGTSTSRKREIPELLSRYYLELLNSNESNVSTVQENALQQLFNEIRNVLKLKGSVVDAIMIQIQQVTDETVEASIMTIVREHDLIPISSQMTNTTSKSLYKLVGINNSNQHLSLSDEFYKMLYDNGARIECFSAGYTNSRFINQKLFPNAKFCALFYDSSSAYIGDFFRLIDSDTMPDGDLIANPPFVETIMERTVQALFKHVSNKQVTAHLVLPKWDDSNAFKLLRNTHNNTHNKLKVTESKYDYGIIDQDNNDVRLKTKLVYFIIEHI